VRALMWLLLAALLILVGAFPWLATAVAGLMVLAASGAVALLAQPPILITGLLALAAVAVRRRHA
jgi:hypothetical protein